MSCVVSESISAQNQKKSVTDGRTDRPTSPKLYPFASRGITGSTYSVHARTYLVLVLLSSSYLRRHRTHINLVHTSSSYLHKPRTSSATSSSASSSASSYLRRHPHPRQRPRPPLHTGRNHRSQSRRRRCPALLVKHCDEYRK